MWAPQKIHQNIQCCHQRQSNCKPGNPLDCHCHPRAQPLETFPNGCTLDSETGFPTINLCFTLISLKKNAFINSLTTSIIQKLPCTTKLQQILQVVLNVQKVTKWTSIGQRRKECLCFFWARGKTNKDSFSHQTLVRFSWAGLGPVVGHVPWQPNFSKNLVKSFFLARIPHSWPPLISDQITHPRSSPRYCLITLAYLQQESHSIGLARTSLPFLLPLVIFYPLTTLVPPHKHFAYKFPLFLVFRIELSSYWGLFSSIAIVLKKNLFLLL